jgi:hypothetical protein
MLDMQGKYLFHLRKYARPVQGKQQFLQAMARAVQQAQMREQQAHQQEKHLLQVQGIQQVL